MKRTSYGKKVGNAIKAIARMHADVSKLLLTCDDLFSGYDSVFGTNATRDLTYSATAAFWMASGVYRYWVKEGVPVVGLTIVFHSAETELAEPLIILGHIQYVGDSIKTVKEVCDPWHLWYAIRGWSRLPINTRKTIKLFNPDGKGTIKRLTAVTRPLFSIENIDDVKGLFEKAGIKVQK